MAVVLTPEMRAAMRVLRSAGVTFYPTRHERLDCGCFVLSGWDVVAMEQVVRVRPCSTGHKGAYVRAVERWEDPDVLERLGEMEPHLSMVVLLREEIAR